MIFSYRKACGKSPPALVFRRFVIRVVLLGMPTRFVKDVGPLLFGGSRSACRHQKSKACSLMRAVNFLFGTIETDTQPKTGAEHIDQGSLQPVDAGGLELEACSRLAASVLHPDACKARVHSCVQVHVGRGFTHVSRCM